MSYTPEPLGLYYDRELQLLQEALARELYRISAALQAIEGTLLPELHAEPAKPRAGMIVLADGSDWDPGSGAGYYGYYGGSWSKLG